MYGGYGVCVSCVGGVGNVVWKGVVGEVCVYEGVWGVGIVVCEVCVYEGVWVWGLWCVRCRV